LTNAEAMNIGPSEQQQQQNISSIGSFQQQQQRLRHASPLSPTGPYGGLPTTAAAELSASQKQQQQVFLGNLLQSGQYIICEQPPPNATATKQPLLVQPAMQHQQISAAAIPQPFDHNQHQQQQNPQQMGAIENDLSSSTIGDQEAQNVASKQLTSMQHAQHAQQIDIKQALEYLNKIKVWRIRGKMVKLTNFTGFFVKSYNFSLFFRVVLQTVLSCTTISSPFWGNTNEARAKTGHKSRWFFQMLIHLPPKNAQKFSPE
jgi:hypothetical protein